MAAMLRVVSETPSPNAFYSVIQEALKSYARLLLAAFETPRVVVILKEILSKEVLFPIEPSMSSCRLRNANVLA